jgi:hypothetical protein
MIDVEILNQLCDSFKLWTVVDNPKESSKNLIAAVKAMNRIHIRRQTRHYPSCDVSRGKVDKERLDSRAGCTADFGRYDEWRAASRRNN